MDHTINSVEEDTVCEDCVIPAGKTIKSGKCVTCPFCHQVVNAIVTDSYIQCPSCQVKVTK